MAELIQRVFMLLLDAAVPALFQRLACVQLSQPLGVNVVNQAAGGKG